MVVKFALACFVAAAPLVAQEIESGIKFKGGRVVVGGSCSY